MAKTKKIAEVVKTEVKSPQYYQAIGRRKTATARVRLYPVTGDNIVVKNLTLLKNQLIVNGKPAEKYFQGAMYEKMYNAPFRLTSTMDRFAATIKVTGSGLHGQLDAVTHGISRALLKIDNDKFKPLLKKEGYLSRDPRAKERRKAGLAGKARAGKQSPKR